MRGKQDQGRRNPRETGGADVRKRRREQKPGDNRQQIATSDEQFVQHAFENREGRIAIHECRAKLRALSGLRQNGLARIDHDGFTRAAPYGEVGGGISRIIKTAHAKFFRERLEFVIAAQVYFAVAAENFVEQPDVIGDGQRHLQIRRGGEN